MNDKIEKVAQWIITSKRTVVFAGAGLSTESGIPDFRSPGGVWDRYDPQDFYFQNFLSSETSREKYWQMSTEMYEPMKKAQPNPAHLAIGEMEKLGKLDCVITQNVDGLHFKAGNSEERVLQLHGTAMHVSCLSCRKSYDRDMIQERLRKTGGKAPRCDDCGGFLKPATISFGQSMPERETREAEARSSACDLFLAAGSSLVVYPAAQMPVVARQNGAKLVIMNFTPTPHDRYADVLIAEKTGETLMKIVTRFKEMSGIK